MNKQGYSQERLMQVLLAPQISEKATMLADKANQVVFLVVPNATKPEIKAAVETLFNVKVSAVRVANTKGKTKRFGRLSGRRSNVRKAFVSLMPGHEINFAEGIA